MNNHGRVIKHIDDLKGNMRSMSPITVAKLFYTLGYCSFDDDELGDIVSDKHITENLDILITTAASVSFFEENGKFEIARLFYILGEECACNIAPSFFKPEISKE